MAALALTPSLTAKAAEDWAWLKRKLALRCDEPVQETSGRWRVTWWNQAWKFRDNYGETLEIAMGRARADVERALRRSGA